MKPQTKVAANLQDQTYSGILLAVLNRADCGKRYAALKCNIRLSQAKRLPACTECGTEVERCFYGVGMRHDFCDR